MSSLIRMALSGRIRQLLPLVIAKEQEMFQVTTMDLENLPKKTDPSILARISLVSRLHLQ